MVDMAELIKLHIKIVPIGIVLFASCSSLSFADTIMLKDGGEIRGQIIEDTDEEIKLKLKFDVMLIKKEDIETIKKEEITEDLILTEDGVKDQWGSLVPPFSFDVNMMCSQFENSRPEQKAVHCKRYFSLAKEYELKAKYESIPELREAGLMTALLYYRVASKSPDEAVKKSGLLGVRRCSAQLFNADKGEIAIPYGTSMADHINHFIEELDSEAKKKVYTDIYLEMGENYEAKANKDKPSEEQLKNIRIAMSSYLIVMTHSPDEESKLLARKNYQQCRKLRDIHIVE